MNKWTLIALIQCESDDTFEKTTCIAMFEDILSRKLPDGIAIVVWLQMAVETIPLLDPDFDPGPNVPEGQMTNVFYAVTNLDEAIGTRNCRLTRLDPGIQNPSIIVRSHVQAFFSFITTSNYAGQYNLLVVWGHGTSYGVFYESQFPPNVQRFPMLSADDLRRAILGAFTNQTQQKIDLMIAVSCFTNFIDTCLELSAAGVDYLVAAPNGNKFVGYNYDVILDKIYSPSSVLPKDLATLVVNSISQPGSDEETRVAKLSTVAIFANDLSFSNQLANLVDRLGEALESDLTPSEKLKLITDAAGSVPAYFKNYFDVDLYRLLAALSAKFGSDWQSDLMAQFRDLYNKFHLKGFIGNGLKGKPGVPMGVTVCLPGHSSGANFVFYNTYLAPGSPFASSFSTGNWAEFGRRYMLATNPAGLARASLK